MPDRAPNALTHAFDQKRRTRAVSAHASGTGDFTVRREQAPGGAGWEVVVERNGHEMSRALFPTVAAAVEAMAQRTGDWVREVG